MFSVLSLITKLIVKFLIIHIFFSRCDSVKIKFIFCNVYRLGLTYWKRCHNVISKYQFDPDFCRSLEFKPAKVFDGQRLINHVIRIDDIKDRVLCKIRCFKEPNCVSYNFEKQPNGNNGTHKCELNDVTHEENEDDLVRDYNYFYRGAEASVNYSLFNYLTR